MRKIKLEACFFSMLTRLVLLFCLLCLLPLAGSAAEPSKPDGADVVAQCYYKYWGDDQRTRLRFTMKNKQGRVTKRRTFIRFWKDYRGQGELVSKVMLFTIAPPEYRQNNFLRVNYTLSSGKPPEQWLYMKRYQTIRRMTIKEKNNLDWGMIAEDLDVRQLDEDRHILLKTDNEADHVIYEVKSVPRVAGSIYGRMISHFVKKDSWDDCRLQDRIYYDKKGKLIKKAQFSWQQIGNVWLPDTIDIRIEKPRNRIFPLKKKIEKDTDIIYISYQFSDPRVNIGLQDRDFSQRNLRRKMN